jgi:CubicO group peptidase (beta-lactamase class C family)
MFSFVMAVVAMVSIGSCRRIPSNSENTQVDKLFAAWTGPDTPGCAVGISRSGTIVYEHGYGMANLELNVPNTPQTVFAIASITKAFTAMSVLIAAQQGKLSLDDEVQKYIPEWTDRNDHITIRHLLTHTSGLRDAFTMLGWAPFSLNSGDINEAMAKLLSRQRGLNFSPGAEYQYNNGGYNLLATILKRATGQSLREFTDANIFKPLGMTHTHVHDDVPVLVPNRASGYTRGANGWRTAKVDGDIVGNSGMYSTVGDLLLWEENFETRRVGTPSMFAAMQTPTKLNDGREIPSGLGIGIGQYRGLPVFMGSGGDYGIASKFAFFPNQHFAVAVLCNEDNSVMGGMARADMDAFTNSIADIYLKEALGPAEPATHSAPSTTVKVPEKDLPEMTGLYSIGGVDQPALISVDHGKLMVRAYYRDGFDIELTPIGTNRFLLRNTVPLEFIPASSGRPKEWHVGERKELRVWQPVTFVPPAAEMRTYAGEYRSSELSVNYVIEVHDSKLILKSSSGSDITISPFTKDVFVGDVAGIVKFTRDVHGTISGFTFNRDAARGVRFDKISN